MDNKIVEKRLIGYESKGLFTEANIKYSIPLYQRAFAWEEFEIEQLIDDINDFKEDKYYLGALIVDKKNIDGCINYEVIDGQQRLITLYLIFNYLEIEVKNALVFECRDKYNYTLQLISQNKNKLNLEKEDKNLDENLLLGYRTIEAKFNKIDKESFERKLKDVILYRIEVPEHTELNKYFEIMNTRGEQLEQQDILKARLISAEGLEDDERKSYAKIWEACSDMTGYVQMHFDKYNRELLFGNYWRDFTGRKFLRTNDNLEKKISIKGLLRTNEINKEDYENKKSEKILKEDKSRFQSIITFPYFLLHVLKIYVRDKEIKTKDKKEIIEELMDDKKLLNTFENVFNNGYINNNKIKKSEFVRGFIECLLKCRYLFDKYFIKREYLKDNIDVWSLQEIYSVGQKSKKSANYKNTNMRSFRELNKIGNERHKRIIMLESCLRVSYTSPKIMHWITEGLEYLYHNDGNKNLAKQFENYIESIIKKNICKDYLNRKDKDILGVNTPHIVLNYLDYLLWKRNQRDYIDFVFEFRNSVEHWYPRNPSVKTFPKMNDKEGLNCLGNLCLIQRNLNAKFSNVSPISKKETFKETVSKGSIKLRIMAELTKDDMEWKDEICRQHNEEMQKLLEDNCL